MSNNSENFTIYVTLEDLSSRLYDYSNSYFLPITAVFGLLTSSFCLVGSARKDTSNSKSLNFIFINSVANFLFLLTQFFVFLFRCGNLCPFSYNYFPQLYQIQIFWFLGYSLVNSQCYFGIYVSTTRYRLFSARKGSPKQNLFIVYLICAFISLVVNVFSNSLPYQVIVLGNL